jgi:UDP-galactopyranose mutase
LFLASKEIGLEVNSDKTKYMAMSLDQNAGSGCYMKTEITFYERVEELKFLGTNVNQNFIQEEIKSGLKSGNACYYSVQNLLSSSLLSKYKKIKNIEL